MTIERLNELIEVTTEKLQHLQASEQAVYQKWFLQGRLATLKELKTEIQRSDRTNCYPSPATLNQSI